MELGRIFISIWIEDMRKRDRANSFVHGKNAPKMPKRAHPPMR